MLNKNHDEKMAALATWVFALALARCPWVRSRARLAFPLHSVICMLQDGYDLYENTNYYCVDNEDLMRVPSRFPGSIVVGVAAQREEVVFPVAEHRPSGGGGRCGWCAAGPVRLSNWPPDSKRDGGGGARLRLTACRGGDGAVGATSPLSPFGTCAGLRAECKVVPPELEGLAPCRVTPSAKLRASSVPNSKDTEGTLGTRGPSRHPLLV